MAVRWLITLKYTQITTTRQQFDGHACVCFLLRQMPLPRRLQEGHYATMAAQRR